MDNIQAKKVLEEINFGDIDGFGDPNLERYFLDSDYWNRIIESDKYFVIGRKGTGKSAIYRIIKEQGEQNGHIVENTDFGEFPFERLLNLDDNDFSAPNQYQSIWKHLILNLFSQMITRNNSADESNVHYKEILLYVEKCIGKNVLDLHKESMHMVQKTSLGLQLTHTAIGHEFENTESFGINTNNITRLNSHLQRTIEQYLVSCDHEVKFIIQFDRLDDNYNQYQNLDKYFQAIISLFKVVYEINQKYRQKSINNAKIVLYLRSDILLQLAKRDAESARWDAFRLDINWAVVNRDDWNNPMLLQMINKRIAASLSNMTGTVNKSSQLGDSEVLIKQRSEAVFPWIEG
ncbi:MAG: hypothetical protein VB034_04840 [Eubacteriales bacterium]|nr:hypothetical protein [Eubacteriales bacterium]